MKLVEYQKNGKNKVCSTCEHGLVAWKGRGDQPEEKKMAKKGTCVACKRDDMVLPAMGLCGSCYAGKNRGDLVQDDSGKWEWLGAPPGYWPVETLNVDLSFSSGIYHADEQDGEKKKADDCALTQEERNYLATKDSVDTPAQNDDVSSESVDTSPRNDNAVQLEGFNFVRCVRSHRNSLKPILSVRFGSGKKSSIEICLNAAALDAFDLDGYNYADVYVDKAAGAMAMHPMTSPTDSKSLKARRQDKKNLVYSATSIMREMGITETGKYNIREVLQDSRRYLVVDFKDKAA
jgi:hypothetical protein